MISHQCRTLPFLAVQLGHRHSRRRQSDIISRCTLTFKQTVFPAITAHLVQCDYPSRDRTATASAGRNCAVMKHQLISCSRKQIPSSVVKVWCFNCSASTKSNKCTVLPSSALHLSRTDPSGSCANEQLLDTLVCPLPLTEAKCQSGRPVHR